MTEWIYFIHPPRENFGATMTEVSLMRGRDQGDAKAGLDDQGARATD